MNTSKYKNPLEKLEAYLKSPEFAHDMELRVFRQNRFDERAALLYEYFKTITDHQIDEFLKWEEEYEEYEYTVNHTQTVSNIFSLLIKMFETFGIQTDENLLDESFLAGKFTIDRFELKVYCGQGCFYRLFKDNNQIFQTI